MKLKEYLQKNGFIIMLGIAITGQWCVDFNKVCIKRKDGLLEWVCGLGDTPENAIKNYIEVIKDKELVFDGFSMKHGNRTFFIPKDLEL